MFYLESIELTEFRNYERLRLEFGPGLNGFLGRNGMGKTNLLDAIYYLCMTKSHFGTSDQHLARHGATFFRLAGTFWRQEKPEKVVAKVIPRKSKVVERNDLPYSRLAEHIGWFPVVFTGPDDIALLRDGSEERRRLVDNTLCQTNAQYLQQLTLYQRLLQQRNALLKSWGGELRRADGALIEIYNQQMADPAAYLYAQRSAFFAEINPLFQVAHQQITGQQESVELRYQSSLAEMGWLELLAERWGRDLALQRTTQGLHRDDLLPFYAGEHPLQRVGSQGQLKSFLLALKLAQYQYLRQKKGLLPILLLDDLFDKLDEQRIARLVELLAQGGYGQVFISDTHDSRLSALVEHRRTDYQRFLVENGQIIR